MKLSTIALFVNAAMALPGSLKATKQLTYDPNTSITIFTDSTCTLSKYLTPNQPLSFAYPIALSLGVLGGPLLNALIGHPAVEDIDVVADELCVSAQQEPNGGNGICQNTLQAIYDLATAKDPKLQADKYKCLLNLLCVARAGYPYQSPCVALLAGADCIANRIADVDVKECEN